MAIELGEDDIGRFGPDEGFGIIVVLRQVTIDGGLAVSHASISPCRGALADLARRRRRPLHPHLDLIAITGIGDHVPPD